ncbi:glycosyltransferase-like protein [Candidatus Vecturithrix granuli]|uniref:Glycosyltransferase-like protein n=1 Tax=Vecturithrix granuli TaxID=1499967 RepID=A0A081C7W5_VECG1|nr:glycosyltransferase-like protein [Candidatus Vecturithrix granuli]
MKILLIAYYYPPIASGGTERAVKMAAYLRRFGHEVWVLTQTYQPSMQSTPSEIRVYDPSHNRHRVGIYTGQWLGLRLYTELLNRLGIPHSIYSWWKGTVLKQAKSIVTSVKPEVILATYPPVEDLEIGLFLAQQFDLRLVADFRDGFLYEPIETRFQKYTCLAAYYARIEQAVAEHASAVITAFPTLSEYFSEKYDCQNVVTMTNGWDAEDFDQLPEEIPLDPAMFNIVHTGSVGGSYSRRDIRPLLEALHHLLRHDPQLTSRLRVHFVGLLQPRELAAIRDLQHKGVIIYHGMVPRKTALAFQVKANLLLLITSSGRKGAAPGKLFEYLCAKTPVLALASEGYTKDILERTGVGWSVAADDVHQIADLLSRIVSDQAFYASLHRSEQEIAQFSRETQMRKLHEVLMTL